MPVAIYQHILSSMSMAGRFQSVWLQPARQLCLLVLFMLGSAAVPVKCEAGLLLDRVRRNGVLRCGVNEGLEGFSLKDAAGTWRGLDADFCRAVAAAALGAPDKVRFVPLAAPARFPALSLDQIDLLSRNTTYTFSRDAEFGLHFAGVLFFDQQAVMVPAKSKARRFGDLQRATICVVRGTTHESNLADFFAARSLQFTPLLVNSLEEGKRAFFTGRCQAYTSDISQLVTIRHNVSPGEGKPVILPGVIAKEPLGPAVKQGDEDWLTLVKWVLFALIEAEELGISQSNVRFQQAENGDQSIRAIFRSTSGRAVGLDDDWFVRVIEAVGNYGEMYERNLGRGSRLLIDRGLNRLWTNGGLMYSPPLH